MDFDGEAYKRKLMAQYKSGTFKQKEKIVTLCLRSASSAADTSAAGHVLGDQGEIETANADWSARLEASIAVITENGAHAGRYLLILSLNGFLSQNKDYPKLLPKTALGTEVHVVHSKHMMAADTTASLTQWVQDDIV